LRAAPAFLGAGLGSVRRRRLACVASGANTSINCEEVASLLVSDISVDRNNQAHVSDLNAQTQTAWVKRAESAALRQSAWAAFEAALFTPP
jgi:hypothetical protein